MLCRNTLYDLNLLKSYSPEVATISIGNINVGGTGKTPMVEYLLRELSQHYNIAILSRGYGRKSKGYIEVNKESKPIEVGDEPLLLKSKFENCKVAVCENRVYGVKQILAKRPDINLIVLDDAFQHRRIKPFIQLLLTSYQLPYFHDLPFPAGRLREFGFTAKRADALVVTKCPHNRRDLKNVPSKPRPLFYSSLEYEEKKHTEVWWQLS